MRTCFALPRSLTLFLAASLLVAACAGEGSPPTLVPDTAPTETPAPTTPSPEDPTPLPVEQPPEQAVPPTEPPGPATAEPPTAEPPTAEPPAAEPPATAVPLPEEPWRTAELSDVRTGETLVVNELTRAGRLVVIEPMAIWCTSCRTQQNEVRTALASLDRDDIVFISLDVDPNETESDLARYADEHDYPWHFVVASREVARSLALAFGDQVLSPPSTPKIVVAEDGSAEVSFGIKRASELEAQFSALLP